MSKFISLAVREKIGGELSPFYTLNTYTFYLGEDDLKWNYVKETKGGKTWAEQKCNLKKVLQQFIGIYGLAIEDCVLASDDHLIINVPTKEMADKMMEHIALQLGLKAIPEGKKVTNMTVG